MTPDIWHIALDPWRVTPDTWHMMHNPCHVTLDTKQVTHDTWLVFAVTFSSIKQVTYDTWHVTPDIWHLTHGIENWTFDTWYVTNEMCQLRPTKWHMTSDYRVGVCFLLLPFLTCDRLQVIGKNWHLTHDIWEMDMQPDMGHLKLTRGTSHLTMGWVSGFTVIGACHLSHVRKATARATHPSNVSYITWCQVSHIRCPMSSVMFHV